MRASRYWRAIMLLPTALLLTAQAPDGLIKMKDGNPQDEILVQGKPVPKSEVVKQQAKEITRMDDFHSEPLAQIQEKVCPGVLGLPVDMAGIVVDRIRYNAERIGLKTAKEGKCSPNVLVAFVLNGQFEVKELARTKGWVFRSITVAELKELTADSGPVHAWSSAQMKGRDGSLVSGDMDQTGQPPVVQVPISDSHVFLAIRRDISQSVVVMDIKAIDGMSVVQLADYATMRAFARTRPVSADSAASTILSLFDKSAPAPRELTAFDLGYLNSIYRTQGNLPAAAKIGAVPKEIRRELAKATTRPPEP